MVVVELSSLRHSIQRRNKETNKQKNTALLPRALLVDAYYFFFVCVCVCMYVLLPSE
jgi:hypothetical protein